MRIPIASILAGCFFCASALADNVGDIEQGEAIAMKECSVCHAAPGAAAPASGKAPTFAAIANMESTTVLSIRVFMRTAHRNKTMPSIILSEAEIDAVASYILSLRK